MVQCGTRAVDLPPNGRPPSGVHPFSIASLRLVLEIGATCMYISGRHKDQFSMAG
jgi:hypothetical protein